MITSSVVASISDGHAATGRVCRRWSGQNRATPPPLARQHHPMKIAVLTSGGDSAGMNAVVRAVVKIGILRQAFFTCRPTVAEPPTEAARPTSSVRATRVSFAATPSNTSRTTNHSPIQMSSLTVPARPTYLKTSVSAMAASFATAPLITQAVVLSKDATLFVSGSMMSGAGSQRRVRDLLSHLTLTQRRVVPSSEPPAPKPFAPKKAVYQPHTTSSKRASTHSLSVVVTAPSQVPTSFAPNGPPS